MGKKRSFNPKFLTGKKSELSQKQKKENWGIGRETPRSVINEVINP